MITLTVYFIGGILGILFHFIFETDSMSEFFAQFTILISFTYTFIGRLFPNVRHSLIKMVPSKFPFPKEVVYLTGFVELLIAIGILINPLQHLISIIGILLCIVLFPANIKAFIENIKFNGEPPTNIWLRLIVQVLFILSFTIFLFNS